jgi:hypothetical protein
VLLDHLDVHNADYGVWRPVYQRHAYRALVIDEVPENNRFAFAPKAPNPEADFPRPLDPVDDLPPVTVVTHVRQRTAGTLFVRGTTSDNGTVKEVVVNGRPAQALAPNFAEWEVVLDGLPPGDVTLSAHATDAAGNVEKRPHLVTVRVKPAP